MLPPLIEGGVPALLLRPFQRVQLVAPGDALERRKQHCGRSQRARAATATDAAAPVSCTLAATAILR